MHFKDWTASFYNRMTESTKRETSLFVLPEILPFYRPFVLQFITTLSATLWAFNPFCTHTSQHMISQSPDRAKWKWVQRSHDYWERRKQRTKWNTTLHLCSCWLAGCTFSWLVWQKHKRLPPRWTSHVKANSNIYCLVYWHTFSFTPFVPPVCYLCGNVYNFCMS